MPISTSSPYTTTSCVSAKKCGGITGCFARRSANANAISAAIPPSSHARAGQLLVVPSTSYPVSPSIRHKRPSESSRMPGTSSGPRTFAIVVGSVVRASAITTIESGMLAAKIQCHESRCVSTPPTSGPTIAATPQVAATRPSAAPRRSCGMRSAIAAVATGKMPPAPNAWIARAARKTGQLGAAIASTDPAAKIATHAM